MVDTSLVAVEFISTLGWKGRDKLCHYQPNPGSKTATATREGPLITHGENVMPGQLR